jgi:hypothetical protein
MYSSASVVSKQTHLLASSTPDPVESLLIYCHGLVLIYEIIFSHKNFAIKHFYLEWETGTVTLPDLFHSETMCAFNNKDNIIAH